MENGLRKPLLHSSDPLEEEETYFDESLKRAPTTDYAKAGIFGIATFRWLNSILEIGSSRSLSKDDVPLLSREHRARKVYESFIANWPKQHEPNSVRRTLFKTFWRQFVWNCSSLAVVRLSVLFVGPVLIKSFVAVTSGGESFAFEGYLLVLILFLAKSTEVISSHAYQFNCQKLGIQVRSALISAVYRKGLRLSSFARQIHGAGQIVNYMSVDVQQMSDSILQLNNIWMVPSQIVVALCILFSVTGISALAGVLVMFISGVTTVLTARFLKKFQKRLMLNRDKRLTVTVEALSNMKIVKLQAWDAKFLDRVSSARESEYRSLRKFLFTSTINSFSMWITPLASVVAIFACSYFFGESVSPTTAFTTIATVKIVQEPLRLFPQVLIGISQASISLQRLERYLWDEELETNAVSRLPLGGSDLAINVEGATFKWSPELEIPTLLDINLQVKPGSMVAVVGKVGMGKSSLLAALLGEMTKVAGTVKTSGSIAYVAQQAWIQSGTIQENILFGSPMDKARYQAAVNSCSLRADFEQMEFGDQTEIGERGLNLSGGQKQRIQLARAVYQDSDIYLLDDIFSAVDAHTASDLFRDCIVGGLASKTVVLVTHQIDFLPGADLIVVMRDGSIVQLGHYEDLLTGGTDFETLVEASNEAFGKVLPHEPQEQQEIDSPVKALVQSTSSQSRSPSFQSRSPSFKSRSPSFQSRSPSFQSRAPSFPRTKAENTFFLPGSSPSAVPPSASEHSNQPMLEREFSQSKWSVDEGKPVQDDDSSAQLTQEEGRETGKVSWSVYWLYFTKAYKGVLLLIFILIQVVWQGFQIGGDYWVAYGSTPDGKGEQTSRFIVIYALLGLCTGITVLLRSVLSTYIGLLTSQSFYLGMLRSLFRAPMSFFDTTPSGRILSRVSTDQAAADVMIPIWFAGVLGIGFQLLGVFFVTLGITWQLVFLLGPLGYAYYKCQKYYFSTARELTRVDAITRAPVIHHFSETIAGFLTIRSFQQEDRFVQISVDRVDSNLRIDFHNQACTEWVGLRMEMIGILLLCSSTLLLVVLRGFINPELVGLCLTYGMNLNGSLFITAWMYCQLENKMVSIERIGQYTELPCEAELSIEKTRPASSWPTSGQIVMQNLKVYCFTSPSFNLALTSLLLALKKISLSLGLLIEFSTTFIVRGVGVSQLRYRPQTPLVLKGITVTIEGGHKVGVVGRTGSGKSTLILALFRLVEAAQGVVLIDDIDISTLGLNDLRARLSIIPQDPTLFDGTVRSNLDPLAEHSDTDIWEALEKCQLASTVKQLEEKLDAPVLENGENWSLGQRQLFCLGRVLLKRSRILVLDEATASVDAETDSVMQSIVRREFEDCTVISIAHRIPTVMDSNKVLVLDAGKVKEYGSPSNLLDNPKSLFSSLVKEYSSRSLSYADLVGEGEEKKDE